MGATQAPKSFPAPGELGAIGGDAGRWVSQARPMPSISNPYPLTSLFPTITPPQNGGQQQPIPAVDDSPGFWSSGKNYDNGDNGYDRAMRAAMYQ